MNRKQKELVEQWLNAINELTACKKALVEQLERSHDDEYCVIVDIRDENGETVHYREDIYYSAEAAVKAYTACVAKHGAESVDIA